MSACGPTNTLYGVDVRGTMQKEFADVPTDSVKVPTMRGGTCACAGGAPKLAFRSMGANAVGGRRSCRSRSRSKSSRTKRQRGGGGCSGGTPMLRSLGIMAGGSSRSAYKPTARNLATLRRFRAGKSIGFTMRASLKAKGLIPRSNGTYKVSSKYR